MKILRAILIDPDNQTVTEIKLPKNYKEIYKVLDCETFACPLILDHEDTLYIDDEGLFKDPERFFSLACWPTAIAGKALILGTDGEGESVDAKADINAVKNQISWLSRKETLVLQRAERESLNRLKANPPPGVTIFGVTMADVTGDLDKKDNQ